jgi:LmbE family N-acetylglucosaminyl deacetylase
MTRGDKGSNDQSLSGKQIAHIRTKEQENAARFLGVSEISYLDYPDGYIVSDIDTRKKIVLEIRKKRPDIVVSCDPLYYYRLDKYINHPDHRATGQNVVDAVFPAAGNAFYFPELLDRGFLPHTIEELWLASPSEANTIIDITANFHEKLNALYHHASQISDRDQFTGRMMDRRTHDSSSENPRFEEKFRRLFLK